jgi:catalase
MVAKWKKVFQQRFHMCSNRPRESEFIAKKMEIMITTGGNPVAQNQNSITAGPRGLFLMRALTTRVMHSMQSI